MLTSRTSMLAFRNATRFSRSAAFSTSTVLGEQYDVVVIGTLRYFWFGLVCVYTLLTLTTRHSCAT